MAETLVGQQRHPQALGDARPDLQAITVKEAAKRLGIDPRTIYRMEKRGELRLVRYSSRTRVPITELERLLTPTPPRPLDTTEAWAADHPDE